MRIAVVGIGYVGLVSAACFAEQGHDVWAVDIDANRVARLREGICPIVEPGLEELVRSGLKAGKLRFETDLAAVLPEVEVVLSAVATPMGESHQADLRAVYAVVESIGRHADRDLIFANKSTVPVGTGRLCQEKIDAILAERGSNAVVTVVSNPEFLREGAAVRDTLSPERVVVGINGGPGAERAETLMRELYAPVLKAGARLLTMSRESAEIVKYASNSFLATKISFINMMSELCEITGADIRSVAEGMGLDTRIGPHFLQAGIGYGGSCFPKDVKALLATARELNIDLSIIAATDQINHRQRSRFLDRVLATLPPASTVAVWGLAFKPLTDDVRDAPSLTVVPSLLEAGHRVVATDPGALETAKRQLPDTVTYAESPLAAATEADAVVLLTEWPAFREVDLAALAGVMRGTLVFDGRLALDPERARAAGLSYHGVGLPSSTLP